jgi:Plastocyanin
MTDQTSRRGRGRFAIGLLAGAIAGLVLLVAGSVQAATVTVAAMNYEFQPASRTVAVGDVVRWTFSGDPHSVTSRDGLFDSGVTNPGGSFQFKFVTAGTYRYYCQVHPEQMFGTIVVKASATPKPTVRSTPRQIGRASCRQRG